MLCVACVLVFHVDIRYCMHTDARQHQHNSQPVVLSREQALEAIRADYDQNYFVSGKVRRVLYVGVYPCMWGF